MSSTTQIDLNLHPSGEDTTPDSSTNHDQQTNTQQSGDPIEALSRMVADLSQLVQYLVGGKRKLGQRLESNGDRDDDDSGRHAKARRCSCGEEERLRLLQSKPKVSTVFVRVNPAESSLVVKDGYQWKKYGQKVTRDNPSPRAYFKCSFAPLCPVKKKVQNSAEDRTVLVVTYEGEHTHSKLNPGRGISSTLINLGRSSCVVSSPEHLVRPNGYDYREEKSDVMDGQDGSSIHDGLVEKIVSSLTKDSSFAATLADVISDKVLEQTFCL